MSHSPRVSGKREVSVSLHSFPDGLEQNKSLTFVLLIIIGLGALATTVGICIYHDAFSTFNQGQWIAAGIAGGAGLIFFVIGTIKLKKFTTSVREALAKAAADPSTRGEAHAKAIMAERRRRDHEAPPPDLDGLFAAETPRSLIKGQTYADGGTPPSSAVGVTEGPPLNALALLIAARTSPALGPAIAPTPSPAMPGPALPSPLPASGGPQPDAAGAGASISTPSPAIPGPALASPLPVSGGPEPDAAGAGASISTPSLAMPKPIPLPTSSPLPLEEPGPAAAGAAAGGAPSSSLSGTFTEAQRRALGKYHSELAHTINSMDTVVICEAQRIPSPYMLSYYTCQHAVMRNVFLGNYAAYQSIDPLFMERHCTFDAKPILQWGHGIEAPPLYPRAQWGQDNADHVACSNKAIRAVISLCLLVPGYADPDALSPGDEGFEKTPDTQYTFIPDLPKSGVKQLLINGPDNEGFWRILTPRLDEAFTMIDHAIISGENLLVHCKEGISRSSTVICAYLMNRCHVSRDKAINYLKSIRQQVKPHGAQAAGLALYEEQLKKDSSDK